MAQRAVLTLPGRCEHGVPTGRPCEQCASQAHDRHVGDVLGQALTLAADAYTDLDSLRGAVDGLAAGPEFDLELIQSNGARDALHALDAALRHLRNVHRILSERHQHWKDDHPAPATPEDSQ